MLKQKQVKEEKRVENQLNRNKTGTWFSYFVRNPSKAVIFLVTSEYHDKHWTDLLI